MTGGECRQCEIVARHDKDYNPVPWVEYAGWKLSFSSVGAIFAVGLDIAKVCYKYNNAHYIKCEYYEICYFAMIYLYKHFVIELIGAVSVI